MNDVVDEYETRFPFIDLSTIELDRSVGSALKEEIADRIEGICIGRISETQMSVAVADPTRIEIYNIVEVSTEGRYKASLLRADPNLLALAREWVYRIGSSRAKETWLEWLPSKRLSDKRLSSLGHKGQDEPETSGEAVERTERILKEAIAMGVSDIHLEMYKEALLVRYRHDGVLRTVDELSDPRLKDAVVKRLKVLSQMDVTQSRSPQGGRISAVIDDSSYDFRVSLVPVKYGESIVLRLLHGGALDVDLTDLGFSERQFSQFRDIIHRPHGLVLVTGPTGSGKTTTLYASLKDITRPDRKLVAVEDPIEYEMPGVVQVQVNNAPSEESKKVTFARILREFLRQDPDVILVGEIRDKETAEVSVKAALTGHLVLSTLHTNDSIGIISRLKDLNVKPFLLASTLIGGIGQRLVRRVCQNCQEPYEPTEEELKIFEAADVSLSSATFKRGRGCVLCRRSGFAGRVALFEILQASRRLKHRIESEATQEELLVVALEEGFRTLLQSGLEKAAQGLVCIDEVRRVCAVEKLTRENLS